MAYIDIYEMTNDYDLRSRVTACAAEQQEAGAELGMDPLVWTDTHRWAWAASPGWAEAYAYAKETHTDEKYAPGRDPAVITDGMILAEVQVLLTAGTRTLT